MILWILVVAFCVVTAVAFVLETLPLARADWREWRVMRALGLKRRKL
jgi:hypothetical protein